MKPKPLKERIREILVNLIAFHDSGVPVLKYDIDQAEQSIKATRLSIDEIRDVIHNSPMMEQLLPSEVVILAHALYEAQTKKEEG